MRISTTRVAAIAALGACAALGLPTTSASATPDRTPAGIRWTADLDGPASDAVNIARTGGLTIAGSQRVTRGPARTATVLSAPHATAQLVASVRADVDATVPSGAGIAVEIRGQRAGGTWTEWRDAGTALPTATATVQARVTLTATDASPVLRSLRLTAMPGTPALAAAPRALAARTYRVYATREGLAGSSTANGHVITSRDHFVALPSRRGLSPKGSSQYSVKVCNPSNGRCETAPVWDVGPWNTKDDYWNPSSQRQMWQDLPQGKPEAQAAYQDGYNNRKDEFNRTVPNPAGIDLADGTFYDGLGMNDNGWVNVTYLWTGDDTPGGGWPTVQQGSQGEDVKTVQYLLNHHGASLAVDGDFGSGTGAAVRQFQSSHGLTSDGIVGPNTWGALIVTVQKGSNNTAVRAVQSQLTAHGYNTDVDGDFGSGTDSSVRAFQGAAHLGVDGIVGPLTWQALVGS